MPRGARARLYQRLLIALLGGALLGGVAAGCAILAPLPDATPLKDRLETFPKTGLPLHGRVTIYWNEHQIPFIEASHDADAAFALGLVHAHLRLGQMEIYRRISQGRIAEMAGPLAVKFDHALRILNYGRAVPRIEASLPSHTRSWIENFVAGINHYQYNAAELPPEFAALGLTRENWTVGDVLTLGRLAGSDVNWLVYLNALPLRQRDDWPAIWARLVKHGSASVPSFARTAGFAELGDSLAELGRSGSNSIAIGADRSKTGQPLLANDPHLGISMPNLWLIAGIQSPSYSMVGLMVPGLPVIAVGRNPWIAWGGTNMRAASSDLVDLKGVPAAEFTERRERIKIRWWFDRDVTVRDTRWGPVLSDASVVASGGGPEFALRWTGHLVSDELSAMLAVGRARDFAEFRNAFRQFAVPGENMLYADGQRNIGQVMAVRLPRRQPTAPADMLVAPAVSDAAWAEMSAIAELPYSLNPENGYLASANNRPTRTDFPIGWFFSANDRIERMAELVEGKGMVGVDDLGRLQTDVYMSSAVRLRDTLLARLDATGLAQSVAGTQRLVVDLMRQWDGYYRQESRGPVAFELFRAAFLRRLYELTVGIDHAELFVNSGRATGMIVEDIAAAPADQVAIALRHGLAKAAESIEEFANWGAIHRLQLAHPLGMVPILGARFRFGDYPVGGGTDTLMKTAHGPVEGRHATRYGANARHISDMSDPNANYFVLLGGQDGWFNSSTFVSQVPLWLAGDYVRVPLTLALVRQQFKHHMLLQPATR